MSTEKIYDTIVLGAGLAGLSTCFYLAKNANINIALISNNIGGYYTEHCDYIELPGIEKQHAIDYCTSIYNQLSQINTVTTVTGTVAVINYKYSLIKVILEDGTLIFGKSLIYALGTIPAKISGLSGKKTSVGIYYSPISDKAFLTDNYKVLVHGNNALALQELKIYNNSLIYGQVAEIKVKDNLLIGAKLKDGTIVQCDAIFAATPYVPNTAIIGKLQLVDTNTGYVKTVQNKTAISGIFAAGDCVEQADQPLNTILEGFNCAAAVLSFLGVN